MASQPTIDILHDCLKRDVLASVCGLPDTIFDVPPRGVNVVLRPGAHEQEVAALALLSSIFKKCEDDPSPDAKEVCLLAFLESNLECGSWRVPNRSETPLKIRSGRVSYNPCYGGLEEERKIYFFNALKINFLSIFNRPVPLSLVEIPGFDGSDPFSWNNVFLLGDVGPGAGLDASGNSWLEKFGLSSITATSEELLEIYWTTLGNGSLRASFDEIREASFGHQVVSGGRFDSVPKSFKTDRSIEIQPTINMWAQKGISVIIEHYVRAHCGLDLSCQQVINRELAGRASFDGSLATIDLKEASNRIPWSLVQSLLGNHMLLDLISMARVQNTQLPWGDDIELSMCSTMGNGFTFALQTAIFLSAVETVLDFSGYPLERQPRMALPTSAAKAALRWSQVLDTDLGAETLPSFQIQGTLGGSDLSGVWLPVWGVFGDDLIVPTKCVPDLIFMIESVLGGKVNADKSFHVGDFRESCGADWYRGLNVRPVYARSLKTPQDRLSLLNRLISWSGFHRIPLPLTCQALWASIPEKLLVPMFEGDTAGLQVLEHFAPVFPKSESFKREEKDYQRRGRSYKCFVPKPSLISFQGCQLAIYGPGILLAMLKGEVTALAVVAITELMIASRRVHPGAYKLLVRSRTTSFAVRWAISYDWNRPISPMFFYLDHEWSLRRNLNLNGC